MGIYDVLDDLVWSRKQLELCEKGFADVSFDELLHIQSALETAEDLIRNLCEDKAITGLFATENLAEQFLEQNGISDHKAIRKTGLISEYRKPYTTFPVYKVEIPLSYILQKALQEVTV